MIKQQLDFKAKFVNIKSYSINAMKNKSKLTTGIKMINDQNL